MLLQRHLEHPPGRTRLPWPTPQPDPLRGVGRRLPDERGRHRAGRPGRRPRQRRRRTPARIAPDVTRPDPASSRHRRSTSGTTPRWSRPPGLQVNAGYRRRISGPASQTATTARIRSPPVIRTRETRATAVASPRLSTGAQYREQDQFLILGTWPGRRTPGSRRPRRRRTHRSPAPATSMSARPA